MRHELRLAPLVAASALSLFASATHAAAQEPSRAARVLTLMAGDAIGVLVTRERVFVPDGSISALSVCSGARCAPVRSSEACSVPRCPGSGMLLSLESPIADVSDLPTDRDGFNRAMAGLRADPALSAIAWSFGAHPDPAPTSSGPPRWITRSRIDGFGWELGAYAIGGVLGATGTGFSGGEVSAGFRFTWDPSHGDDDFLAIVFGDVIGLDARLRIMALLPGQGPTSSAVLLGIAPAMGYGTDHEIFRLPTLYSVFLPEFGLAFRENRDPAWYAGWSLPVTLLLDEHLGVEARPSVLIVDDWIPGDDVEVIVSVALGLVGR